MRFHINHENAREFETFHLVNGRHGDGVGSLKHIVGGNIVTGLGGVLQKVEDGMLPGVSLQH